MVATIQTGLSSPSASRSSRKNACCSCTPVRVTSSSAWSITIEHIGVTITTAAVHSCSSQLTELDCQLDQPFTATAQRRCDVLYWTRLATICKGSGHAVGQVVSGLLAWYQRWQHHPAGV